MADDFNIENAVPVTENSQGTHAADSSFNVENAVAVDAPHTGLTPYDSFKEAQRPKAEMASTPTEGINGGQTKDNAVKPPSSPKEGQPNGNPTGMPFDKNVDYPHENALNAGIHLAEGAVWNTLAKPFMPKDPDMDEYLNQLEKKHPIANVVAGTAPFIATSAFMPESLLPNIYARTAAQFGMVGFTSALGTVKDENDKPLPQKAGEVIGETVKQAAFSPIFAKAQTFQLLDRPFATALVRAGIISSGSTVMNTVFGENITESFKQGGVYGALSLIMESPHLAKTAIGRGITAHANGIYSDIQAKAGFPQHEIMTSDAKDMVVKAANNRMNELKAAGEDRVGPDGIKLPARMMSYAEKEELKFLEDNKDSPDALSSRYQIKINPDAPVEVIQSQASHVAGAIASQIKGINEPHIIAATIKLSGGIEIHGTSHEDALGKIGRSINKAQEFKEIPDVSFEDQPNSPRIKNIKNKAGKVVGDIVYANDKDKPTRVSEEGIDVSINEQRKGYGKGAINKVFNSGIDLIQGDVSKTNKGAQEFWRAMGARLVETSSGNFKMFLKKEDFQNVTGRGDKYESGFTVQNPDGTTKFITKEQSKEAPFNLPNGEAKDVKGLEASKFLSQESDIKIVNPDTLEKIKSQEGKLDIALIPGVPETAEVLQKSHQELKEKFAPYEVGQEGKYTAEVIRENLGVQARSNDRLEESLSKAKDLFEKADKDSSLDFIYRMEEGVEQKDPSLQKVAVVLRELLDTKRNEVIDLGTGKLENYIENYFPHVWEDPNKVGKVIGQIMGRRPFEGKKSFLKKRTIMSTRDGIELGFTPVSYNPIDSVLLKVREMNRYIMAQRSIQALKEQGLVKFVPNGKSAPDGFVKIDDRFADVVSKNDAGELVIRGKYMAQKDAARILNNYLSPGLAGKSYIYDMYRGAGNTLNQFQLGISAFHLGFTSMDATISKFALGINKLSAGDSVGALKEFAKTPFAPITNIMQGRELLQAWYGKDKGEMTNLIADLMASAGGRAKMDAFYATGIKESLSKSLKEGKLLTGSMKVPFYIVEQVARPIMEYIVPRQKMGVFMDIMKMELERNPNISHEQLRTIAQKAWDSVDNRMGQMVYDNLFWNRTTKDLAMASVRSLGWNLGTIREIGGGVKDIVKELGYIPTDIHNSKNGIRRKSSGLSYRAAYVLALPIVTGLYGAIYQYLHTGQGPQEVKDYFFPKTGAIDTKGESARISLPTYMKDIYHYTTNPVQTVLNKFSPVNNTVIEMLNNKDFYGVEIHNADDPTMVQFLDEAKFVGSQFIPFGFRNQNRDTRKTVSSRIEPFIGLTPAPYDVNMTKAERTAHELVQGHIPVGSRTKEQAEHSKQKAQVRNEFMTNRNENVLRKAVTDGVISSKESRIIAKESRMTSLERLTQHLTVEEVEKVLNKATEKERPELEMILRHKRAGKKQRGTWTQAEEEMYAKSLDPKK